MPSSSFCPEVVRQQADAGIRVVNDGEFGRISWLIYAHERLSGFKQRPVELKYATAILKGKIGRSSPIITPSSPLAAGSPTTSRRRAASSGGMRDHQPVCSDQAAYRGRAMLRAEIDNLKATLGGDNVVEGFMTSTAPGDIVYAAPNDYYQNEEDYLYAVADASPPFFPPTGLVLQIDYPIIPAYWDLMLTQGIDIPKYHRYCEARIEVLNHALADLPKDRIRYHICWGSHDGPHVSDIPIKDVIPMLLKVRASGLLFEAANSRHEHEWQAWRDVKLPDDTVLIPGVIGHATNTVDIPAGVMADQAFRGDGGQGERHCGHRLRYGLPRPSADCQGEIERVARARAWRPKNSGLAPPMPNPQSSIELL